MSSPLWPTALSPVADGDVAIRTRSRNTSFQRADSFSSPWPSSAPHLHIQSQQICPALCPVPLWGSYCRELLYKHSNSCLLRDFVAEQAMSMSIRVKAGSWRLCGSFLLCWRETRSAGVLAALTACLRGNIANSGLGQINLVSYRIDFTLAFKFPLEIKL